MTELAIFYRDMFREDAMIEIADNAMKMADGLATANQHNEARKFREVAESIQALYV